MRKYSEEHEWIEVEGDIATVGITDYAQSQLGDIVFADLPGIGEAFDKDAAAAVIESVKAASDIYAPLTGEIVEVNSAVTDNAALINSDAEGEAWLFKIKIKDASELDGLMDEADYKAFIE